MPVSTRVLARRLCYYAGTNNVFFNKNTVSTAILVSGYIMYALALASTVVVRVDLRARVHVHDVPCNCMC